MKRTSLFPRAPAAAGMFALCLASPVWAAGPGVSYRPMMGERCERMNERLEQMDRNLSTDQVRDIAEGRIAMSGEKTLKVGKVSEKDGVAHVDIVTKEGSLVITREISTKTGLPADAGKHCQEIRARASHVRAERPGRAALGIVAVRPGKDLNLSAAQAKSLAEAALVLAGNPRLKVGDVREKDADTISVDIVTQDNAVALKREVNRHTGHFRRAG